MTSQAGLGQPSHQRVVKVVTCEAVETLFFGAQLVLIIFSCYLHWKKRTSITRPALLIFYLTIFISVLTFAFWVISLASKALELQNVNMQMHPLTIARKSISCLIFVCSDSILLWRMRALCFGRHKKLGYVAMGILGLAFVSFTVSLVALVIVAISTMNNTKADAFNEMAMYARMIAYTLSLVSNMVSTVTISWTAWSVRRLSSRYSISFTDSNNEATRGFNSAVVVLAETGVVYLFLQVVLVLTNYLYAFQKGNNLIMWMTFEVYLNIITMISALYPSLIVVLVALQRSLADTPMWKANSEYEKEATSPFGSNVHLTGWTDTESVPQRDSRNINVV